MQFHFEKTLEKRFEPQNQVADGTPAWRVLWLAKALRDWFGQPHRTFYQSGSCQVQFGYEALSFPVSDFASFFGAMVGGIGRVWPVQVFGLGDGNELVELSVIEDNGTFALRQRSISGVWQDELQDLYLHIQLPSPHSASGVFRLLNALEKGAPAAALEWDYGEFLEGQGLSQTDHTTSFCYVFLEDDWDQEDTVGYLAGLKEAQKSDLWRRFLQDHLHPPEFEWLRDALIRDCVPNWIEWHLALYRLMEQLGIHFLCQEGHFQMLDAAGKRLYFGVDHADAAEQMLMKILFPLNQ